MVAEVRHSKSRDREREESRRKSFKEMSWQMRRGSSKSRSSLYRGFALSPACCGHHTENRHFRQWAGGQRGPLLTDKTEQLGKVSREVFKAGAAYKRNGNVKTEKNFSLEIGVGVL